MFGVGYDAGALLDTPEASQEATQAVGDDSDPLPAPLAAAGAAPEAEQEAVWGEINPEKLALARRIQPSASGAAACCACVSGMHIRCRAQQRKRALLVLPGDPVASKQDNNARDNKFCA